MNSQIQQAGIGVRLVPRIVIFNVKYSPNLGDGIIAECLEHALRDQLAEAKVLSIDVAGRREWTAPRAARTRAMQLRLLDAMPRGIRDIIVAGAIGQRLYRTLQPQWQADLKDADVVIFGGGQLIQDGDLNFPLKLAAAARECRRARLPIAIYGVGAARLTSRIGRILLSGLFESPSLAHVAARDLQSVSNLAAIGHSAVLCRDPGLLASQLWPRPARMQRSRICVGLCITHPAVLRHHSTIKAEPGKMNAMATYKEIAIRLAKDGFDVLCFSNGAAEDQMAMSMLAEQLQSSAEWGRHINFAQRPRDPRDLAQLIADLDIVIAHRLHAAIVAFSYGVPAIGLRWDSKLDAFFESVHRSRYLADFDEAIVKTITSRVQVTLAEGNCEELRSQVLKEAYDGIKTLTEALLKAHQNSRALADNSVTR